jgi:hypothetical protein
MPALQKDAVFVPNGGEALFNVRGYTVKSSVASRHPAFCPMKYFNYNERN